jgi:5'-3' exonuclease
MNKPLLVIDGDSFSHRAYHAVPKTIRRTGNKGAGAIVGFANFLLKLYESEQPAPSLSAGTRSMPRLTGMKRSKAIKLAVSSTMRCLTNSMCCQNS